MFGIGIAENVKKHLTICRLCVKIRLSILLIDLLSAKAGSSQRRARRPAGHPDNVMALRGVCRPGWPALAASRPRNCVYSLLLSPVRVRFQRKKEVPQLLSVWDSG